MRVVGPVEVLRKRKRSEAVERRVDVVLPTVGNLRRLDRVRADRVDQNIVRILRTDQCLSPGGSDVQRGQVVRPGCRANRQRLGQLLTRVTTRDRDDRRSRCRVERVHPVGVVDRPSLRVAGGVVRVGRRIQWDVATAVADRFEVARQSALRVSLHCDRVRVGRAHLADGLFEELCQRHILTVHLALGDDEPGERELAVFIDRRSGRDDRDTLTDTVAGRCASDLEVDDCLLGGCLDL